jgi:cation diffusion facilitator CzcD-associated flavoprotein CzcO
MILILSFWQPVFQVAQILTPMHIVGSNGQALQQQWDECRGAQAYLGTHVHNFPNLAILFGPNTFPANNSALLTCETQVDYAVKSLFKPLLDRRAAVIEVKQAAEDRETNAIHQQLTNTVFDRLLELVYWRVWPECGVVAWPCSVPLVPDILSRLVCF